MIEISTVANIAEIAGGIAILISLTYAGFQIRQSNRIARVESVRATQSMAFLDHFDMAEIGGAFNEFESLDYSAKCKFHSYFLNLWGHWQMIVESNQLGLISDDELAAWIQVMAGIMKTRGVQQYFEAGGRTNLMSGGLTLVEDYLNKNSATITPYNEQYKWMQPTG
jgi:hypothetical protein